MSENNNIEFSNILLLKENINEEGNKKKSNNELFKMELNRLKTNFNKLSINEIINKKEFNFKDLLMSKLNIQFPNLVLDIKDPEKKNNNDENDKICLSNSPLSNSNNLKCKSNYSFNNKNSNSNTNTDFLKEQNDVNVSNQNNLEDDKDEIINVSNYNVIITNKEKDFNSDINSDKDSFLMSPLHKDTKTENIYSYNNDNDLLLNNNKSFSSNNNLFVVQTENNKKSKNRNLLGNKRNKKDNHTSNKNKKEELFEKILSSYNKINKDMHNVQMEVSKEKTYEIKSIIVDNDKLDNVYISNGKIKKIFSHKNNSFYTKEKDIVGELKIISDIFDKKL